VAVRVNQGFATADLGGIAITKVRGRHQRHDRGNLLRQIWRASIQECSISNTWLCQGDKKFESSELHY
jgi:hypothetical protein